MLVTNLLVLALVVSEIYEFIGSNGQTNRRTNGQTNMKKRVFQNKFTLWCLKCLFLTQFFFL